jgi:hypothetical protein
VLVERTVKEVVPALKTNSDGLKKVLDDLLAQYKSKQDEMDKWKVRYFYFSFNFIQIHDFSFCATFYTSDPILFQIYARIDRYRVSAGPATNNAAEEEQCPGRTAVVSSTSDWAYSRIHLPCYSG